MECWQRPVETALEHEHTQGHQRHTKRHTLAKPYEAIIAPIMASDDPKSSRANSGRTGWTNDRENDSITCGKNTGRPRSDKDPVGSCGSLVATFDTVVRALSLALLAVFACGFNGATGLVGGALAAPSLVWVVRGGTELAGECTRRATRTWMAVSSARSTGGGGGASADAIAAAPVLPSEGRRGASASADAGPDSTRGGLLLPDGSMLQARTNKQSGAESQKGDGNGRGQWGN